MGGSVGLLTGETNSRLARRGGVKRISAAIYEEARLALVNHLKAVCSSPIESNSEIRLTGRFSRSWETA